MTNNRSAVLYRASNILAMDYPFRGAIESALCFADEAIVVCDTRSTDGTLAAIAGLAAENRGRVIPVYFDFTFDRLWQEKAWTAAAAETTADWHIWLDLDELIHEDHHAELCSIMADEDAHLINLPFVHLCGTPRWRKKSPKVRQNTRFGRRSQGYKMVNRCTDKHPEHTCVFVEYNGKLPRFLVSRDDTKLPQVPIMHYGWARSAQALAISGAKHHDWYADGEKYSDGRIPDVPPHDFGMGRKVTAGGIVAYDGPHPAHIQPWLESHKTEWQTLDNQARET